MKHKSSAIFSALILAGAMVNATPVVTKKEPVKQPSNPIVLTRLKDKVQSRPQAPSRQVIECDYDGAYLTFSFTVPAGECEAAVTEWYSGATQTYTIDSSDLTAAVYVGQLYESTVTLTTAAGTTYAADLTAN